MDAFDEEIGVVEADSINAVFGVDEVGIRKAPLEEVKEGIGVDIRKGLPKEAISLNGDEVVSTKSG